MKCGSGKITMVLQIKSKFVYVQRDAHIFSMKDLMQNLLRCVFQTASLLIK